MLDLSTGARSSVHGDLRLPMMSVFKLPLAVAALDAGVAWGEPRLRLTHPSDAETERGLLSLLPGWPM